MDASVALQWVVLENTSEIAERLLGEDVCAPDLIFAELANALWRKSTRREITAKQVEQARDFVGRLPIESLPVRPLFARALSLSVQLDHPAYDCFYVALAIERDLPLATSDARLVNKLGAVRPRPAWLRLVATLGDADQPLRFLDA